MEIKWLEDFLVLATTRSFSKAAEERNTTQSTLSRRIQQLEDWLGVRLIDRSSQPVGLTRAGSHFYRQAIEILRIAYRARAGARRIGLQRAEPLRFSAQHVLARHFLPRLLTQIEARMEIGGVTLRSDNLYNCIDDLLSDAVDFLVCFHQPAMPDLVDLSGYDFLIVGTEEMIPVSLPDERGNPRFALRLRAEMRLPDAGMRAFETVSGRSERRPLGNLLAPGRTGPAVSDPGRQPLLRVRDLKVQFRTGSRGPFRKPTVVHAVDGISFDVPRGTTFGIVGESGSGKSTTALAIMRLAPITHGTIELAGARLSEAEGSELLALRRRAQIIFQDPYSSLSPRMRAGAIVREPLDLMNIGDPDGRDDRVADLFRKVGLRAEQQALFPHQFSGGQRQRIGVARALASQPDLIVCDEPVSALDVAIQAQILNLLRALQREIGLTYLFISHDLAVVQYICDEIAVMYLGEIVEQADRISLFRRPLHPYTWALLSAVPVGRFETAPARQAGQPRGRSPQPDRPASGMPLRRPVPVRRRHLPCRSAAAARDIPEALGQLSPGQR